MFYKGMLKDVERRLPTFRKYNISEEKILSYTDWECLGAIILGDKGNGKYGSDLHKHEIKSAKIGHSFEYQYCKHSGNRKLDGDKLVNHLVIFYSPDYRDVTARLLTSDIMGPVIESWRDDVVASYNGDHPVQRNRHSVSYGFAVENGEVILKIENGELVESYVDVFRD